MSTEAGSSLRYEIPSFVPDIAPSAYSAVLRSGYSSGQGEPEVSNPIPNSQTTGILAGFL